MGFGVGFSDTIPDRSQDVSGADGDFTPQGPSLGQLSGGENLVQIHFFPDGTPRESPPDLSYAPGRVIPVGASDRFRREYVTRWGEDALGQFDETISEQASDLGGVAGSFVGGFSEEAFNFSSVALLAVVVFVAAFAFDLV